MTWIEKPTQAQLVEEAERDDSDIWYYCEVADEWRKSRTDADTFGRYGTGPGHYRIPDRST